MIATTAKFASNCTRCGQKIEVGTQLEKAFVNGKYVFCHVGCEKATPPASAYRTNSKSGVKKCPRCKDPIVVGQDLEKWEDGPKVVVRGQECAQWVHVGCEEVQQNRRPSVNLTADLNKLLDGLDFDKIDQEVLKLIDERQNALRDELKEENRLLAERVADSVATAAEKIQERAAEVARSVVESLAPRQIEVKRPDGTIHKVEGCVHPAFDKVLQLAAMRKNIFLPGPAGCGKSHMASQVAEALGLEFASISCSAGMSEGQITGRLLPTGEGGKFEYSASDFVRLYENGGVFLLDEIDAADPNVLIVINSAIANGRLPLPNRVENPVAYRHPDFVLIAAANTFGRGSDRLYCGRNELDEATLDRFRIGTVPMDYDAKLEEQLCPHDELRARLQGYRRKCEAARLERIVSSRFLKDAYDMLQAGWTLEDIDEQLFSGWSEDEGFYPTPRPVIDRMIAAVQDKLSRDSVKVLEPSAGIGSITDAVSEVAPRACIHAIEINSRCRDVLKLKGFKSFLELQSHWVSGVRMLLKAKDFLKEHYHTGLYDIVLMNPPFENRQDEQHVRVAYDCLLPGGRLVAIVSAGAIQNQRSASFVAWLSSIGATWEELPEGSFNSIESFRRTGVRCYMVVIDKE